MVNSDIIGQHRSTYGSGTVVSPSRSSNQYSLHNEIRHLSMVLKCHHLGMILKCHHLVRDPTCLDRLGQHLGMVLKCHHLGMIIQTSLRSVMCIKTVSRYFQM